MRGKVAAALILALTLGCGAAQAAPVVLDPQAMRQLANEALQQGYAEQALAYAEALLARDPADTTALIIKARALRALGRYAESEAVARQAWALAKDDPARYGAAMTLAQALSLQDHRTLAQVWLRTAVEFAPNERAKAKAISDFAYVRSQNPLNLRFDLAIQPSDNVNNGAMNSLWEFMGIPFVLSGDALALSGTVGTFGVSGRYRLAQSQMALTDLTFLGSQQLVWLSNEAQAQAPDAQNGDYAFGVVEIGLSQRNLLDLQGTIMTSGAVYGHNWYGGADLSDYARLELGLEQHIAPGVIGFANASAERQERIDLPAASATVIDLGAGLLKHQRNGDSLRLSVGMTRTNSADIEIDNTRLSGRIEWNRAAPVLGMGLGLALKAEQRDYAQSPYDASGRHDVRLTASITAELNQISYFGFSPVLTLNLSQNNSNIGLYDTRTTGLGLSIESRF